MDNRSILYLGDTSLDQQAGYLAGVMSRCSLQYEYLRSDIRFPDSLLERDYDLVIISDYPASNFDAGQIDVIVEKVKRGMSLLMIGGWESFVGAGGDYHLTRLAEVLPVTMKTSDDRVNFSSPCLILKEQKHEITDLLPFEKNAPVIGGLNALDVKQGAAVLLFAVEFKASRNDNTFEFKEGPKYPLLVVGNYSGFRTAAFASDVAPHWVGPFVDWGNQRIRAQAEGGAKIEVGNWYAEFFTNLIKWLCVKP